MFLSKMKEKLSGALTKYNGNKDFLEAVCAASALVASCDGEVTDVEIQTATKTVASSPSLSTAFKPAVIEKCIDTMLKRASAGRTGRMGLYKEIDDVRSNGDMAETVYLTALDIAEADGNVGNEEKKTLAEIAKRLGVNEKNYANV
jgi:tellurite resistance protein